MATNEQQQFYQLSTKQKEDLIIQNFRKHNIQPSNRLPVEVLNQHLDRIIGQQFDREVSEQISEQCQLDVQGMIEVQNFVQVMMQAYNILEDKSVNTEQNLQTYLDQRQEITKKIDESRATEKFNMYGISSDSTLTVVCHQASDLQPQYQIQEVPQAILTCGKEKFQTNSRQAMDISKPNWNQEFIFGIESGKEDLDIEIVGYSQQTNSTQILGQCVIKLQNLKNQERIDDWFTLYDIENRPLPAKINLGLQFIHNKVQYYEEILRRADETIKNQQEDLYDYYQDLNYIVKCMGFQNLYDQKLNQQNQLLNYNGSPQQYQQQQPLSASPNNQFGQDQFSAKQQQQQIQHYNQQPQYQQQQQQQQDQLNHPNPYLDVEDKPVYNEHGEREVHSELKYLIISGGLLILFGLLQFFGRNANLDLTIGFSVIFIFTSDCLEKFYLKLLMYGTGFGIVYDIIWMYAAFSGLWNTDHKMFDFYMEGVYHFVCFMAILSLLTKGALIYFLREIGENFDYNYQEKYYLKFNDNLEFKFGHQKKNIFMEAYQQTSQDQPQQQYQQYSQDQIIPQQQQQQQYNNQYNPYDQQQDMPQHSFGNKAVQQQQQNNYY